MFELIQNKIKRVFFKATSSSGFKFKIYTLVFLLAAIIPILTINAIRQGNLALPSIITIVWAIVFYKLASSLHHQKVVSYWVSIPCAALVIISSFYY
jgi:hypothetical protein